MRRRSTNRRYKDDTTQAHKHDLFIVGDRQIGRESGAIELDAMTQTVDPDQTNELLNCSWSCEIEGGGDCDSAVDGESIFASISGCETEVESSQFFAGATYVIRFVSETKFL